MIMEILKAIAILFAGFGVVFVITYWREARAEKKKSRQDCCG
jgi:hypothetical protein